MEQMQPVDRPMAFVSETKPKRTLWEYYFDQANAEDTEREREWIGTMDTILIFSGLFAAFLAGFVGESTKKLEGEHETLVAILIHQSQQLANTSIEAYLPQTFQPKQSAVITNYLYYTSLGLVLFSAFLAILIKGWARDFNRGFASITSVEERALLRQARYDQLERCHFSLIANSVPLLLFCALALYFAGLVVSLWDLHPGLSYLCIVPVALSTLVYVLTFAHSLIERGSPFGSSLSDNTRSLLLRVIHLFWYAAEGYFQGAKIRLRNEIVYQRSRLGNKFGYTWGSNWQVSPIQNGLRKYITARYKQYTTEKAVATSHQTLHRTKAFRYLLDRTPVAPHSQQVYHELLSAYDFQEESVVRKLATTLHIALPAIYHKPITESLLENPHFSWEDGYPTALLHLCRILSNQSSLGSAFYYQFIFLYVKLGIYDWRQRLIWHLLNLPTTINADSEIEDAIPMFFALRYSDPPEDFLFDVGDIPFDNPTILFDSTYITWKMLNQTFVPNWRNLDIERRKVCARKWWEKRKGLSWFCLALEQCPHHLLVRIVCLAKAHLQEQTPPDALEVNLSTVNTQGLLRDAILSICAMFWPLEDPGASTHEEILKVIDGDITRHQGTRLRYYVGSKSANVLAQVLQLDR